MSTRALVQILEKVLKVLLDNVLKIVCPSTVCPSTSLDFPFTLLESNVISRGEEGQRDTSIWHGPLQSFTLNYPQKDLGAQTKFANSLALPKQTSRFLSSKRTP